jgi:hypothetical protein
LPVLTLNYFQYNHLKESFTAFAFFTPLVSQGHTFVHCPLFCTAAYKLSRNRVSVFVWLSILSNTAKH